MHATQPTRPPAKAAAAMPTKPADTTPKITTVVSLLPADQPTPATTAAALAAVPHTDDVVEYTLRCVLALAPGLAAHIHQATSAQVRGVFGGDRAYISRRPGEGLSQRNAQIRRDWQAGERFELLERRYNLSRAHLWRIVNNLPNN